MGFQIGHHITNGTKTVHLVTGYGVGDSMYTACTKPVRTTAETVSGEVTCGVCCKRAGDYSQPEPVATYADPEHARRNFLHLADKAGTEQGRTFWQSKADSV